MKRPLAAGSTERHCRQAVNLTSSQTPHSTMAKLVSTAATPPATTTTTGITVESLRLENEDIESTSLVQYVRAAAPHAPRLEGELRLTLTLAEDEIEPIFSGAAWAGTVVWEAARDLAESLLAGKHAKAVASGATVVEVGAGIGMPGMLAARLGARRVVLTEQDQLVRLLGLNIAANFGPEHRQISCETLSWSAEGARALLAAHFGRGHGLQYVLCCDCVYELLYGESWRLLADALEVFCCEGGATALVSLERRPPGDGVDDFLDKLRTWGDVETAPSTAPIEIYEVTRKAVGDAASPDEASTDEGPPASAEAAHFRKAAAPTDALYVAGFSAAPDAAALARLADGVVRVHRVENRGHVYVVFADRAAAAAALAALRGATVEGARAPLVVAFAEPAAAPSTAAAAALLPNPNLLTLPDPADTRNVKVPGLAVLDGFLSDADAAALLGHLDAQPWDDRLNRRVQHYGYTFDYSTRHVDLENPAPPLPPLVLALAARAAAAAGSPWGEGVLPDQLTVNEYEPGQGISAHVETHSAFADGIVALSLGSGCVMELRRQLGADGAAPPVKRQVWLAPRSLMAMTGECRYGWSHSIPARKHDRVSGALLPRARRVSVTLRKVLRPARCACVFDACCDVPPAEKRGGAGEAAPTDSERSIRLFYDAVAHHWHHTRGKRQAHWPRAKQLLQGLPAGALVADVGCGDGKYFGLAPGVALVGCDVSAQLLRIARRRGAVAAPARDDAGFDDAEGSGGGGATGNVCQADALALPYRDAAFDGCLSVALLHHLSTPAHRRRALSEMVRVTKPGGFVEVQAWAMEQQVASKRQFNDGGQDILVPFHLQRKFATDDAPPADAGAEWDENRKLWVLNRYCHVYREGELEELAAAASPDVRVVDSGYDTGNWYIRLEKKTDVGPDKSGPAGYVRRPNGLDA